MDAKIVTPTHWAKVSLVVMIFEDFSCAQFCAQPEPDGVIWSDMRSTAKPVKDASMLLDVTPCNSS